MQNHRRTPKESHPIAGFDAMKTGKNLPKPAADRNIFTCFPNARHAAKVARTSRRSKAEEKLPLKAPDPGSS